MTFPPGPRTPALYQIGRWILHPLKLLDECHRRYGDVFTLSAPRGDKFVIVADPDLIKQIMTADPATLLAGQGNATLLEPMLGKFSLLTLDGADHLRQRRLLLPAFHGERMKAYASVMAETTDASVDRWPMRQPFALHSMMQEITLDVILRTVFGVSSTDRQSDIRRRLLDLLEVATNPWLLFPGLLGLSPLSIPWLKIAKLKALVDESIYDIIRDRRRKPTGGADVLSMMLDARDDKGAAMSDVEVRDELVTLLLAGHETTATALAWTFDRLLANIQTLDKLRAELCAGREEYLDCVIRESLRVRPIVPLVGRVAVAPYQLGPWLLPVGTRIAPSIYLAGHRPAAYPNPERFDPDRWIGVKPDPYTWLPFGGGTRRCIGMAFAQAEMRLVLQTVVLRTRMRLADGPASVVRRGITLAPAGGTRVILEERTRHATAA
jgi:cytochrome P450